MEHAAEEPRRRGDILGRSPEQGRGRGGEGIEWVEGDGPVAPQDRKPEPVVRQPEFPLSDDARAVLAQFAQQALYTDDLVRATGFEPNRVFTALTELEICGLIKMINGKRYMLV